MGDLVSRKGRHGKIVGITNPTTPPLYLVYLEDIQTVINSEERDLEPLTPSEKHPTYAVGTEVMVNGQHGIIVGAVRNNQGDWTFTVMMLVDASTLCCSEQQLSLPAVFF